jgi:hypothetical protein
MDADDTETKGGPDAAREAARRLRSFGEGAPINAEVPELIRLADVAASQIVATSENPDAPALRAKLAENLLGALSILRLHRVLGVDPEAMEEARATVLRFVKLLETAIELASE